MYAEGIIMNAIIPLISYSRLSGTRLPVYSSTWGDFRPFISHSIANTFISASQNFM
jgi:hypothetical protein